MEKGTSPSSSLHEAGLGGAPPSPPPAKKGPRCQVEGCRVDLSDAKSYYSRHKVCGMHSKYPKVIVAGLEQRFCQQCSRFHQLPEFDQGKRSCRRRLAGHNERRRKPPLLPPPPRYRNLCPSIFGHSSKGEGFVMDFSASSSERGFGNQAQLTWQRYNNNNYYSQNAVSDVVQGTSANALSLLSNQPKTRVASGLEVNNLLGTNGVQPSGATTASFACSLSCCFKDGRADSSLHEMHPDLGLGQSSHPNNGHYNDAEFHDLYDSPVQHMHWLL
ncbi:hypothetical protein ACS0TY_033751 [Phlomoides rotata]